MFDKHVPPVLFLVFNRPDVTLRAFESIREAKPKQLFVAADGPREGRLGDIDACREVRNIIAYVDWDCDVKTLFRDENLGCRVGVSTAIDWFFSHVEEGVILEDDCLADQTFFRFCGELLSRYRNNDNVMVISGDYFLGDAYKSEYSFFFSRYNHCWGWASWRDSWKHYDKEMSQWPGLRDSEWLDHIGNGHRDFEKYWKRTFDRAHAGEIDSWAYRWTFSCWACGGLTALPTRNLVKNIGFDSQATHTQNDGGWISRMPLQSLSFPLAIPENIVRNVVTDRWTDLNVVGTKISFFSRVKRRIRRLLRMFINA